MEIRRMLQAAPVWAMTFRAMLLEQFFTGGSSFRLTLVRIPERPCPSWSFTKLGRRPFFLLSRLARGRGPYGHQT